MKATATTFLLGALVGAALALGVRAAILSMDEGAHTDHSGHSMRGGPSEPEEPAASQVTAGLLLDLGNERCPIMGGEVDGKTYSEWNGLRIGHCCPPCIEKLLAAPEKVLDDAGIEWREAARLVEQMKTASGEKRRALLTEAGKRFTVVRRPEGWE
jgi:hypothetical protein